ERVAALHALGGLIHQLQCPILPGPCVREAVDDEHVVALGLRRLDAFDIPLRMERVQLQNVELEFVGVFTGAPSLRVDHGHAVAELRSDLERRIRLAATGRPNQGHPKFSLLFSCPFEGRHHSLTSVLTSTLTEKTSRSGSCTVTPGTISPVSASTTGAPGWWPAGWSRLLISAQSGVSFTLTRPICRA